MFFSRLRVPVERTLPAQPRDRFESGFHSAFADRGDLPQRALSLVPPPLTDEFAGLDRLDREELDEE
jgi:hypothetical protein